MCKSRANGTGLPMIFLQDTPSKTCKNSYVLPKLKNTRAAKIPLCGQRCSFNFNDLKKSGNFWFSRQHSISVTVNFSSSLSPTCELYNI